jgi:signal transduction histidine kinase
MWRLGLLHFLGLYLYRRLRVSRARLAVSEANASRANATKDRLMRIIGHDLRGPVTTFQQALPLVRYYADHPDPAELTSLADALTRQAQELRNLLDNLLQWSLAQTHDVRNAPTLVDCAAALAAIAALYRPVAEAKGVTLVVEPPAADRPTAWADPALLSAILRNLTSNALKFTPAGGRVTLRIRTTAESPGRLVCAVEDTGVGMSPEQLQHLFEPSVDRSTPGTAGEAGTGLGLLVCHYFAELLGGPLQVSSRPGVGTTCWFSIAEAPAGTARTAGIMVAS